MTGMTTDDLIAAIGADPAPLKPHLLRRAVLGGLGAGLAATLAVFAFAWGMRPDLGDVPGDAFLAAKTVLPMLLGLIGARLVMSRARPGATSRAAYAIWAVPVTLVAIMGLAVLLTAPEDLAKAVMGHSVRFCLASIPVLSIPILAGLLVSLRRGAPEHPARCGALAGLAAGGMGAAIYSLHCTEDSPLFYGVWYVLAILAVIGLGAAIGTRVLRW